MFEYAALVDAPVQRFTGIVTGSEPDDAPPVGVPKDEAPVLAAAVVADAPAAPHAPGALERHVPERDVPERDVPERPALTARPMRAPIAPPAPEPVILRSAAPAMPAPERQTPHEPAAHEPAAHEPAAHQPAGREPAARESAPRLPFVPALVAIAAAGVTAMWWLRRDGHDR
jgi:hypothetical protein